MTPDRSAILEETFGSMGYSPADSADILQLFSTNTREFLCFFNKSEILEILEALLFIYIAENSHTTNGRGDGAYGKFSPKGTLALKECGLVQEASWQEVQVLRTTREGARVGSALLLKRIHSLNFEELAKIVHPLVPFLLAGSSHYRYVEKVFPLAVPESDGTFLSFATERNPVSFRELERFSRTLAELGLAVVACGYPPTKEGGDCWQYVFPGELVFILKEIIGEYGEEISRKYLEFVEYIRRKFIVLQFLSYKRYLDEILSSRELQADLITYLDTLSDSIEVMKVPSQRDDAGIQFIVRDEARYRSHLCEISDSLRREIAAQFGEPTTGSATSVVWRREGVRDLQDTGMREERSLSAPPSAPVPEREDTPERPAPMDTELFLNLEMAEMPENSGECNSLRALPDPDSSMRQERMPEREDAPWRGLNGSAAGSALQMRDPGGDTLAIFLGYSGNGEAVYWSPGTLNNGHFIIIGGSGAGKTETIRCIATELERQDYPVLLIDFHGDMAIRSGNLRSYRIREGSAFYFNPLELDPTFEEITPLRATSDFVDAISINFPTLGIQQRRAIKGIIKDTYGKAGITSDRETWFRRVNFDDIEDAIMNCEDEAIPAYLEDIFDYKLFSGTEKIAIKDILSGGITHMNLNALPENLRYLFADLFLRRLFYSLQALGEIPRGTESTREKFRLFIIVDEAKLLVSQKTGQKQVIKAVLNKYATEMRKFGVSLILASQLISHFNDEILANIAVKLCMRTENKKQAQENSKFFEVSEIDLMNFQPGEGILIIGSEKMNVKIVPTKERRGLLTDDRR